MAPLTGRRFAQYEHPTYLAWKPTWQKLMDAYEGTGGFANGTYLIGHPREYLDHSTRVKVWDQENEQWKWTTAQNTDPKQPTAKLLERRKLARYEHWPRKLIKAFSDSLFRQVPTRQVGGQAAGTTDLEAWWQDVDGQGTDIDDFWAAAWKAAAVFGSVYLYMDSAKTEDGDTTESAADSKAPFLRVYTPLDLPDWVDDLGELHEVKFLEPAPRKSLNEPYPSGQYRYRYVTEDRWELYDQRGALVENGAHGFGRLPVVPLYSERRVLTNLIGASVLGDPALFVDYYNLTSELRELLRKQTFGILNVPLGPNGSVESEQVLLGQQVGTDNVMFSHEPAQFLSPSGENAAAYQEERQNLLRAIFRLGGIQWEADSRDAEAEGSLKLKREDLNTGLAAYADELERADYAVAKLFYIHQGDSDLTKYEQDEIQIRYPDNFDVTPFEELLAQAQTALALGLPIEAKRELRKRLVGKLLPDLPDDVMSVIEKAIEQQEDETPPSQLIQAALAKRVGSATPERAQGTAAFASKGAAAGKGEAA